MSHSSKYDNQRNVFPLSKTVRIIRFHMIKEKIWRQGHQYEKKKNLPQLAQS